jgi:hypothetical protein
MLRDDTRVICHNAVSGPDDSIHWQSVPPQINLSRPIPLGFRSDLDQDAIGQNDVSSF